LPAIRREQPVLPRRPSSATGTGRSRTIGYSSAADAASSIRQADLISKPTSQEAREFLEKRFGVPAPARSKRQKHKAPTGRLHKTYTCPPAQPLPYINRVDATAPLPEVHLSDAQNGVFGLIQKGLVPKGADATAAFVVTPAPVLCGPVTLHKFEEQFKKVEIATGIGFPISSLKLDIITKGPLPSTAQRQRMFSAVPAQTPALLHTSGSALPLLTFLNNQFSQSKKSICLLVLKIMHGPLLHPRPPTSPLLRLFKQLRHLSPCLLQLLLLPQLWHGNQKRREDITNSWIRSRCISSLSVEAKLYQILQSSSLSSAST
jgi:hypothetical protein